MPWELTRPAGLALLGLLGPLVLLYVLKVRRERRRVSSILLFQAARRDLQASSPFRRLVRSVPLLLEALAISALALALAAPLAQKGELQAGRLVIVIDLSGSMGALEGKLTRLELGTQAATTMLSRLRPGAEVMILGAGRDPELISPFERDRVRLVAALRRLSARDVEGRLSRSLNMAGEQLRQRGGGRILLVTDGAVADADSLPAVGMPLEVIQVGTTGANTAIVRTEVGVTRDPVTSKERVETFALLVNYSGAARDIFVTLSLRNAVEPLASRRLRLEPGERAPVVLGFEAEPRDRGSGLELEVSPPDALRSDDHASLRVPDGQRLPVILAPKAANAWVERALSADREVELYRTTLEELASANVPEDALVVVDGACPDRLPGADLLLLNPPQGTCRAVRVGPHVGRPVITSWAEADPRLRFLTFDGVDLSRAHLLGVDSPRHALVQSRDGVLIADVSSPGRTATLVGFDVGESSWPLRASFVLFMRNVTELARIHRGRGPAASQRTGEHLTLRVPLDVDSVTLEDPSGRRQALRAREGVAVVPAATRVGFSHVSWQGARPGSTLVPTNLASETESRILPQKLVIATGSATAADPGRGLSDLSGWLSALALALIAMDLAWVTRRPPAPLALPFGPKSLGHTPKKAPA